jgi:hypothetical protein
MQHVHVNFLLSLPFVAAYFSAHPLILWGLVSKYGHLRTPTTYVWATNDSRQYTVVLLDYLNHHLTYDGKKTVMQKAVKALHCLA